MIDYNDAEKALDYLKSTDKEAARLKSRYHLLDDRKKTIMAVIFGDVEGKSAADKEKKALADKRYRDHLMEVSNAHEEWLVIYNQRKSAELQIEMWRSVNSNQRKGNI